MKITTSNLGSVPADIRVCLTRNNPLEFKRLFLGVHMDFSTHQLLLYFGIVTLFVELFASDRTEGTIDTNKTIFKYKELELFKHTTNHLPNDYFFNLGMTIYPNYVILFLWKLQLWIPLEKVNKK